MNLRSKIRANAPAWLFSTHLRRKRDKYKKYAQQITEEVLDYFQTFQNPSQEQQEVIDYVAKNGLDFVPYEFTKQYKQKNVKVYTDKSSKMHYVMHNGKKLYFNRRYDKNYVQYMYNELLIEQDQNSPHLYETDDFFVKTGDVVADVGAAEGIFALSVIDKVEKIYLFECESEWIEALQKTFEPYKDKVEIIEKYVSDKDEGNNITLDSFFADKKIDFVKADIEGAEIQLLAGARKFLTSSVPNKIVLCTYHRQTDAENIESILRHNSYNTAYSKGYLLNYISRFFEPPYFRRGVIRGEKKCEV